MTKRQHLTYFAITAFLALLCGLYLIFIRGNDPVIWILLGLGAFFVLFYTWPLKYIAMGELAVLIVWGPLMIGGGYYVLTGSMELECNLGQPALCVGRNDRHFWQAYRQGIGG